MTMCRVTANPDPRPNAGAAIPISAFVLPNTAAVQSVQLTYLVNYGSPSNLPMQAGTGQDLALPSLKCLVSMTASFLAALSIVQQSCLVYNCVKKLPRQAGLGP